MNCNCAYRIVYLEVIIYKLNCNYYKDTCNDTYAAAPLKPYQPNQRMNTPSAPSVRL